MKGIAHFTMGMAIASCFPEAIRQAVDGNGWLIVLGGIMGLLPDTLDFRVSRYMALHDMEVICDPLKPDPALVASALALAINRCASTRQSVRIRLNTIPLGPDRWQSYAVEFDPARRYVIAEYGPVVDAGGNPIIKNPSKSADFSSRARRKVGTGLKLDYEARLEIGPFDGPLLSMEPQADGRVIVRFLPWHRQWSHSLLLSALMGIVSWLLWGVMAGLIAFCAFAIHALSDHAGFMGSNLCYPFTRRKEGLKLVHSAEKLPNFAAVWFCCAILFLNLERLAARGAFAKGLDYWRFVLYLAIIPPVLMWFVFRRIASNSRVRLSRRQKTCKRSAGQPCQNEKDIPKLKIG